MKGTLAAAALAVLGLLSVLLGLFRTPDAFAQEGRGVGDASEVIEVTVVNLDVVARSRSGKPEPDLELSDFRVFDNDQRVDLTYFNKGLRNRPGVSEQLSVIFFIDNLHLSAASRDHALPAIRQFAESQLRSNDTYAMVVTFDGQMRLLHDLTPEYLQLVQGLNQVEVQEDVSSLARNLKRRSQESFVRLLNDLGGDQLDSGRGLAALETTYSELVGYAEVLNEDALETADALDAMIEALALVPGRKAFFLVSDGLAMRPFDRLATNLQRRVLGVRVTQGGDLMARAPTDGASGFDDATNIITASSNAAGYAKLTTGGFLESLARLDTLPRFREIAAKANSQRVTFYALKPPDVEVATTTLGERVAEQQSHSYLSDLRAVLHLLAEDTGGSAMVTGRDLDGFLGRAQGDLESYYSLGYVLDEFERDSRHEVRVTTKKRGVSLRHRTSYVAKSLRNRLTERTSGALLLGWAENPLELMIDGVSQTTAEGGLYDIKLTVSMPLSKLSLSPSGNHHTGQVRLAAAVLTEERKPMEPSYIAVPLQIPTAEWNQAKEQFFAVNFEFSLPRGSHKVAVGLWDENAGIDSYIRSELTVR